MPVIQTQNLSLLYGRRRGIEDVDLVVGEGSIFGFLGPNGAGKTTTIRVLLGFLKPTDGTASIFGHHCWTQSAMIKRDVGYLPGDLRLYPWMTARSALDIVGRIRRHNLRNRGDLLIERFRLEPTVRVRKMSRGMRQKLGLILALAHDPELLVLDEPTSGLDPLMQIELMNILRERAANGATVFFSSHTLAEVEELCDHIAMVRDGCIVANESLTSLRARARRTVTIRFKNEENSNLVNVVLGLRVQERVGRHWRCSFDGEVSALLKWLAEQAVEDVSIGEPDLESIFRAYYLERPEIAG